MFIELSYQDGSKSGQISINGDTDPGWGLYDALPLIETSKQLSALSIIKTGTGTARLDNFKLVAVPETSTAAICTPGGLPRLTKTAFQCCPRYSKHEGSPIQIISGFSDTALRLTTYA